MTKAEAKIVHDVLLTLEWTAYENCCPSCWVEFGKPHNTYCGWKRSKELTAKEMGAEPCYDIVRLGP